MFKVKHEYVDKAPSVEGGSTASTIVDSLEEAEEHFALKVGTQVFDKRVITLLDANDNILKQQIV